jgi:type II secretory ATPase GspE/PulE/Tfp pilus assembly ATPase PilB-like protein
MLVDDEMRTIVLARAPYDAIAAHAAATGTRTLWHDGLDKALSGLTSIDELRRSLADVS